MQIGFDMVNMIYRNVNFVAFNSVMSVDGDF